MWKNSWIRWTRSRSRQKRPVWATRASGNLQLALCSLWRIPTPRRWRVWAQDKGRCNLVLRVRAARSNATCLTLCWNLRQHWSHRNGWLKNMAVAPQSKRQNYTCEARFNLSICRFIVTLWSIFILLRPFFLQVHWTCTWPKYCCGFHMSLWHHWWMLMMWYHFQWSRNHVPWSITLALALTLALTFQNLATFSFLSS